jgi:SAM-dependent methyltransferase
MTSHYTFGDSDLAARRLFLLAEAYTDPSLAFLRQFASGPFGRVLDLGCGPGYTTRLLHEAVGAGSTIGIDKSERYIELARSGAPSGVEFVCHDVLGKPPVAPADLIYTRFLLTHLADPGAALAGWAELLVPRGMLLVQECSLLDSEHPTLTRYYQLVEALQAQYKQSLYIGRELEGIARNTPFIVEHHGQRLFELPAHVMATLHALNVPTWKSDPFAVRNFDPKEVAEVEQGLLRIAQRAELCAPVRIGLAELVLRGMQ